MTQTQVEVPRWTAQEFERLVFAGNPKVAVFDCDGTLWGGDAGFGFMDWSLRKGLVSRSTSDLVDTRYRSYLAGKVSEQDMCGEMVQMYAGLRDDELRAAAARYISKHVQPRIFTEMAALVGALIKAGVEIWAVSSTNKWVVAEGVRDLGIPEERILAAEVRVVAGLITTEILDVPTDEGKAASLKRIGLTCPDAVFGNSIHDLAMLQMARNAFPVNPSPGLLEAAAKKGWGYFQPEAAVEAEAAVGGESLPSGS
ncbi:MAG: haloacid dehalogenase-like hydrolase [Terracidiphilus sp.]